MLISQTKRASKVSNDRNIQAIWALFKALKNYAQIIR